jgi:hypothetical protein
MTKIIINIDMEDLTSGINQMVDEDAMEDEMGEEEEFSCPLSTQDEELNAENRQHAQLMNSPMVPLLAGGVKIKKDAAFANISTSALK